MGSDGALVRPRFFLPPPIHPRPHFMKIYFPRAFQFTERSEKKIFNFECHLIFSFTHTSSSQQAILIYSLAKNTKNL
jgi:hypothetical protein